ncbi:MAG: HNH endonuclease signature motif containing protein [Ferruginibacter sp.]
MIKKLCRRSQRKISKNKSKSKFIRKIVLSAYSNRCAISNTNIPEFLIASHIKRWSDDVDNRLNPSNGICLNALYDRAFDKGFIELTQITKSYFRIN